MTYSAEDFVRREVGALLRGEYRGKPLCSACLVKMTLERLHTGWRKSEITRAMGKVFSTPGAMKSLPASECTSCQKPMPCLQVPSQ
jgi:hypothetical protein